MSIFKTIGAKLKRVISLKNLTNAVTGNFTAIGADVVRVASTKAPTKNGVVSKEQVAKNFVIPDEVNDVLIAKGEQYKTAVASKIASNETAQAVTDIFTKAYFQAFWIKNKSVIIGALVFLGISFTAWKVLKKPTSKRGVRKR